MIRPLQVVRLLAGIMLASVPASAKSAGLAPPAIASFSPPSGPVGTLVTIRGSGFGPAPSAHVVRFGAVASEVVTANESTLTVPVPAGATFAPLTVTTGGLTAASLNPFIVTFGGGGLGPSSYYGSGVISGGIGALSITIGDIDGDGLPDLIVPPTVTNGISVFRNTTAGGNVSFADKVDFSIGWFGVQTAAFGDLDGDGRADLVIAALGAASPGRIGILRNIASPGNIAPGSFASPVLLQGPGPIFMANDAAIADLNGDGKPDLAVSGTTNGSDYVVAVFRNQDTLGSITPTSFAPQPPLAALPGAGHIVAADFDGDGKVDLAVTNQVGSTVSAFRNASTPDSIMFDARNDFTTGSGPHGLAAADLDGDGKADLAVAHMGAAGNLVLLANASTPGTIQFNDPVGFATADIVQSATVGDIDGDGKPDVVVTSPAVNVVSVFRNIAAAGTIDSASLGARVDYTLDYGPSFAALGDLNGDGRPEITLITPTGGIGSAIFQLKNRVSAGFDVTPLNTGTSENLTGASFANSTNGCVAGSNGVVRVTTDGGQTWSASNTGTDSNLTGVRLVGSSGFITGAGGLICLSTDNGANWTPFTTNTTNTFYASSFTGNSSGWAVGSGGTICVYNGTGWTPQPADTTVTFRGVYAVGSTGYAVGTAGTICRYNGSAWIAQNSGTTGVTFNDVAFSDESTGYTVGTGGTICRTTNGGATWIQLAAGLGAVNLRSITIGGAGIAWAVGDGGLVAETSDGGNSWSASYLGATDLYGVQFIGGKGFVAGKGGKAYSFRSVLAGVKEGPRPRALPSSFRLEQNYPNPFNPATQFEFQITRPGFVSLKVYDLLGREVATLVNGELHAGTHVMRWDASARPSGVYYYRLESGSWSAAGKAILLR